MPMSVGSIRTILPDEFHAARAAGDRWVGAIHGVPDEFPLERAQATGKSRDEVKAKLLRLISRIEQALALAQRESFKDPTFIKLKTKAAEIERESAKLRARERAADNAAYKRRGTVVLALRKQRLAGIWP